jgi:hypothetical protein
MVQGISLGKITFAAAALGALLFLLASAAHGDDCQSFTDLPPVPSPSQGMAPRVSWHGAPAARAIPAVWTEYRRPQPPLRGTGSNWIFVPFDGCTGSDSGDFDLRNPSGDEAVQGTRSIAIGFQPGDPRYPTRLPRPLFIVR